MHIAIDNAVRFIFNGRRHKFFISHFETISRRDVESDMIKSMQKCLQIFNYAHLMTSPTHPSYAFTGVVEYEL